MTTRNNAIAIVFDDHEMFADSFSSLIERMELFQSVFVFTDEGTLIQFLIKNTDQREIFLFVDYYLKDKHSLPIINNIRRLIRGIHVVVLSSVTDPLLIRNILAIKPEGFLSKSSGFSEVLKCIVAIRDNNPYMSSFVADILSETNQISQNPFTAREIELLQFFNQGFSISGTAERVFLSKHTIIAHRRHMMEKAKCNSITELLAFSRKRGLI